jgi:hypothetical protein
MTTDPKKSLSSESLCEHAKSDVDQFLLEPVNWTYAPRKFHPTSGPGARRIRAERHNPYSIATLRIKLARLLLKRLTCCPFCCVRRL